MKILKKEITLVSNIFIMLLTIFTLSSPVWSLSMYLEPSTVTVDKSTLFDMEICLENQEATAFDTLNVWLTFDPYYLEVQDTDIGNWITNEDINILDAPYHTTYTFNIHWDNKADNTAGEIIYAESVLPGTLTSTGAFAKITFRALNITPGSIPVSFNFDWGGLKDTRVTNGGVDVLGLSSDHTDGTSGARVAVIPEPSSFILLVSNLIGLLVGGFIKIKRRY